MTAQWLYEDGIGEARALKLVDGMPVAARIVLPGGVRVGDVRRGTIASASHDGRRFTVTLTDGRGQVLIPADAASPQALAVGQRVMVAITRSALVERSGGKLAQARLTDAGQESDGPGLRDIIAADAVPVVECHPHERDRLAHAGWHDVLEGAHGLPYAFAGGRLTLHPTPAMTLIDIDGDGAPAALALAAAPAVAQAIALFDLQGSIGVDFPTVAGRAERVAVAEAFDDAMAASGAGAFERTALNGFGFMQVIIPRHGPSLAELVQRDPAAALARAALRQAERVREPGVLDLRLAPLVAAAMEPDWLDQLRQRSGRAVRVTVAPDAGLWDMAIMAVSA